MTYSHAVSEDGHFFRVNWEVAVDNFWQFLGNIIIHVEVGGPLWLSSIDIEASAKPKVI